MAHTEAALRLAIRTLLNGKFDGFKFVGVVRAILMPCPDPDPQLVCYIAAKFEDERTKFIVNLCAVVPIRMPHGIDSLQADRAILEVSGPLFNECPPFILEVLSEPMNLMSRRWRARSASKPWRYEIIQENNEDGTADLSLVLSARGTEAVLEHRPGIPPEDFDASYEAFALEHPMASLAPITADRDGKRLAG